MAKRSNDERLAEGITREKILPSNAINPRLHSSFKDHEELAPQQVARREEEARKRAREERKRAKKEWKEKWARNQQVEEETWQQEARLSEEKTFIRGRLAEKLGTTGEMNLVRRLQEIDLWEQVLADHRQEAAFINSYEDWYWKLFTEPASPSGSSEESAEAKGEKAGVWMKQRPLIAKSQQARMLQMRKEKQQRKLNEEKRRDGVNAIKETLELARMRYKCHREVRLRRRAERRQLLAEKLKTELAIDLDELPDKGASVVERYERLKRQQEEMKRQQELRRAAILEKLLLEKAARRPATRTTHLHRRRREQGTQEQIMEENKREDNVTSIQTNESEDVWEDVSTVDVAAERKENVLKDEVVSEDALREGDDVDARGRRWILPQNTLGKFQRVAEKYSILKTMSTKEIPEVVYPDDPGMTWDPRCILFKDFKAGQLYRRRVVVTNTSSSKVVCLLVKVKLGDESNTRVLQVKHLDRQRLWAGGSFSFQAEFQPEDSTPELEGEIVFRTTREPSEARQFAVPIHCTPPRPEPSVDPLRVSFRTAQYWTRGKPGVILYRTVHVSNTGGATCTLRVTRASELLDQENAALLENTQDMPRIEQECPLPLEEKTKNTQKANGNLGEKMRRRSSEKKVRRKKSSDASLAEKSSTDVTAQGSKPAEAEPLCGCLVEECLRNALEIFTFLPRYHIEVAPKSAVRIRARFEPDDVGTYSDNFTFLFQDGTGNRCAEVSVEVSGETTSQPLELEPHSMEFGPCFVDGGVYYQEYVLTNHGKAPVSVLQRVPAPLRRHVTVNPAVVLLRPGEARTMCLHLAAKSSLRRDAPEHYDAASQLLHFYVELGPTGPAYGGCPPLELDVLAVVTSPRDISLTPPRLDLGTVTTLETVSSTVWLANHSLAPQRYCFFGLPQGVTLQPGDGSGRLLPGQAAPLVLLYSPGPAHIAGNAAAGRNGLDGEHVFELRCETAASRGARPAPSPAPLSGRTGTLRRDRRSSDHTCRGRVRYPKADCTSDPRDFVRAENSHQSPSGETTSAVEDGSEWQVAESFPQPEISHLTATRSIDDIKECLDKVMRLEPRLGSKTGGESVVLRCRAHVVDSLCQLSCSCLLLPATSCGTLRTAHVSILPNAASRTPCVCGELAARTHERRHVWFRFHIPAAAGELVLQPSAGHLVLGEEVKVLVAFHPQIPEKSVEETARRLKARQLMEEATKLALEQEVARKVEATKRRGKSVPKVDSGKEATSTGPVDIDPQTVALDVSDKFKAEKWLLQNLKAYDFYCKVKCVMETATSDSPQAPRRKEVLYLDVLCPVVRPDVILRSDSRHVAFGRTAISTRPKRVVFVENISSSLVHLSACPLNPLGTFYSSLRNGTGLQPGKVASIVITFAPEDDSKQQELYEIRGGQATLSLMISGEGVRAQFQFIPDSKVYRLESQPGKASTCIVEVENSCTAPLNFLVRRVFVGWAVDAPTQESEPSKVKKAKKYDKMSPELTPEEQKDIDENYKSVEEALAETIFSQSGLSEIGNQLFVMPFGKGQLRVTFAPLVNAFAILGETKADINEDPPSGVEKSGKGEAKMKRQGKRKEAASKKPRTEDKDQSIKYVAKYTITLGRIVDVCELVFFGWTKTK